MVMTRGDFLAAAKPTMDAILEEGLNQQNFYTQYYDVKSSNQAFEEHRKDPGLGLASEIPEGGDRQFDFTRQGDVYRYQHLEYVNGYKLTRNLIEDSKGPMEVARLTPRLVEAMTETKEILGAQLLNEAFSATNFTYMDGLELCSSVHTSGGAGTQRNELSTPADLSEAALEQADADIELIVNDRGLRRHLVAKKLIVAHQARFEAQRILYSNLRVDSANNDLNAIKDVNLLPGGYLALPYLSSANDWFIQTSADMGLTWFNRREVLIETDNDFLTMNELVGASMRLSRGVTDVYAIFGSEGSS